MDAIDCIGQLPIASYFERNCANPRVESDYGELRSYVSECFVRALTARIAERLYPRGSREDFRVLTENGLELAGELYDRLDDYEKNREVCSTIREFIKKTVYRIT